MKPDREQLSKIFFGIGLIFLIGLSSLFTIQWLRADTLLGPENDSKTYFLKTVEFLDMLPAAGWGKLGASLQSISFSGRPPLFQLLSIPFLLVLGRSMDSAVMVNLLFQALLVFSVYNIGKITSNAKTGFLAALLVSVYPPLVQLSRIYRPHFALAACVGLALWKLLTLYEHRSVKNVWFFILALVFGVFIHPKFVFTFWLPALVGSIYILFFQVEPRRPANTRDIFGWLKTKFADPIFLRGFLPALLLGVVLITGWYLSVGTALLDVFETVSSEELGEFRGYEIFTKGLRLEGGYYFWWYLITMPKAISLVFALFFAIGLGYIIWRRMPASLLLIATYLGAYLVFANFATMTWMHFAEVLPVVALISVTWVGETKNKALTAVSWIILLTASLFVYVYVTWGPHWMVQPAIALGAPITSKGICQSYDQVFCPTPPSGEDWKISEILETVVNDPDCRPENCNVLVLMRPLEFDFTSFTFLYYKAVEFPKSPLAIPRLGGFAFDIIPFNFEALLQSPFIVYVDYKNPGESYFGAAIKLTQNSPASFADAHQELAEFILPGGRKARLIKRTLPLTLDEAQDVIRSMDLDDKYKFGQYRVLAALHAQVGQFDNALEAYQKALEYEPSDAGLYYGLAGVYDALGQFENAASAHRQVIFLAPDSDLALQAQSWLVAHQKQN